MNWYVFSTVDEDAKDSLSYCDSYDEAVKEAQAKHQTERRPKRIKAGMYRISHMSNPTRYRESASYIVRVDKMLVYGFGNLLGLERNCINCGNVLGNSKCRRSCGESDAIDEGIAL